ncbi:hypothetical protein QF028_005856 [Neobacillus sp. B4I6]|jgi:hypothetical protein|uniref:hypothetical protein n=1 Tax=Neobacillus sp. B4I6 TaxID=3373925 RepID=UPI003D1A6DCA
MKLDFAINYMPIYSFYDPTRAFLSQVIVFPIMENQHLLMAGSLARDYFLVTFFNNKPRTNILLTEELQASPSSNHTFLGIIEDMDFYGVI